MPHKTSSIINYVQNFTTILSSISIVVAIILGYNELEKSKQQNRFAGLEQAKTLLNNEGAIKDSISLFLLALDSGKYNSLIDNPNILGSRLYQSKELKLFNYICHHYEMVGALIKGEYIDFDLYYEIVPFPNEFYLKTINLRNYIKSNWYGAKQYLPDFLSNFEYLKYRYEEKRNPQ